MAAARGWLGGKPWPRGAAGVGRGGLLGAPVCLADPPSTQPPRAGASAGWLRACVQGEAKLKTHLNTQMNLLLIFIIFTGSCKTLKNPLFMLFMTFFR